MSIDSKAKRMSMLSFASPLAWQHHFEVDGSVDADDRLTLLHLYGGFAAAGAVGGFVPVRRRYILPNGMNVMATPREVAAMLARLSLDAGSVEATPADMADLRDAMLETMRARPVIESEWQRSLDEREARELELIQDEEDAVIALLMA